MNKALTAWIVVALVIIVGFAIYFSQTVGPGDIPSSQTGTTDNSGRNPTPTISPTIQPHETGAPVVVTNSKVSSTDTTAIVNGNVSPNGAFTNYWFEYGTSPSLGNRTPSQQIGSGFTNTQSPAYITGLAKNTTYYFRLVVENLYGKNVGIQYSFKTTQGNAPPVGSSPSIKTLAATGVSETYVTVHGNVNPNKAETIYWFEYGDNKNFGGTTALASAGNGSTNISETASISNLSPNTTYYFRINSQNQFGTVNGEVLSFKTTGKTAPAAPTATTKNASSVTASTATLHGTAVSNGAETTYWFQYSFDSHMTSGLIKETDKTVIGANGSSGSISKVVKVLVPNTTYYFRLVAQNSRGTTLGDLLSFKTK